MSLFKDLAKTWNVSKEAENKRLRDEEKRQREMEVSLDMINRNASREELDRSFKRIGTRLWV